MAGITVTTVQLPLIPLVPLTPPSHAILLLLALFYSQKNRSPQVIYLLLTLCVCVCVCVWEKLSILMVQLSTVVLLCFDVDFEGKLSHMVSRVYKFDIWFAEYFCHRSPGVFRWSVLPGQMRLVIFLRSWHKSGVRATSLCAWCSSGIFHWWIIQGKWWDF